MAILKRTGGAMLALAAALASACPARADDGVHLIEQKIKAGLVYNFLKYTDWPAERTEGAQAPIVVCLLGGDPFEGGLQPMAGRSVNEHTIELKSVREAAEFAPCWLLVVSSSEKASWPAWRASLAGKDVLTVSDLDGFAGSGGMIEFTRTDSRIGVKINVASVTAAHLKVEDRLLKLANAVSPGP
jgi:hypothetical protein